MPINIFLKKIRKYSILIEVISKLLCILKSIFKFILLSFSLGVKTKLLVMIYFIVQLSVSTLKLVGYGPAASSLVRSANSLAQQ